MTLWKKIRLKKRINKRSLPLIHKIYDDIEDLPLWNYDKVVESEDLRYLFILNSYKKFPKYLKLWKPILVKVWDGIHDQIIDEFGFSQEQLMVLQIEKSICLAELTFIIKGDKAIQNQITAMKRRLESLLKSLTPKEKQTLYEKVSILEGFKHIPMDPKLISVKKYLTDLRLYEKYIEQQKKLSKKNG